MITQKLKSLYQIFKDAVGVWTGANAPAMGAATAYYTIFAIAPLFILILALAALCFGRDAAQHEVFGQVSGLVGEKGGEAIQSMLAAANKPKAGTIATILGLITLFVGSTGFFMQLQSAIDAIWNVRPKGGGIRNFLRTRLVSFATLLGIGFLLLVSLIVSAGLAALSKWMNGMIPAEKIVWHIVDFAVSVGVVTALFAMIFKVLPDVKMRWKDVWVGAFITAVLFAVGKIVIGLYLGRSSASSAYGMAGSIIVVLLWVYYSVQILLFGAAATRIYAERSGSRIEPAPNAEFASQAQPHGKQPQMA